MKVIFKNLCLVGSFTILSSCAGLVDQRSFISEMDRESEGLFTPGRDFRVVPGDSGQAYRSREEIMQRTPASYRSKDEWMEQQSLMTELQRRESRLTEIERQDYHRAREHLQSESERIYYLSLSQRERMDYMRARGLGAEDRVRAVSSIAQNFGFHTNLYSANDIQLGMSKSEVSRQWGQPNRVEVAGNPRHENERWAFIEGGRVRYVYFESGRVHGWTLD